MNHPIIRNTEQLRSFMESVKHKEVSDNDLTWFVAYFNASMILDAYDTKDLAAMLQEGIPATTLDSVQPFLDTFYEDYDTSHHYLEGLRLVRFIYYFYGKYNDERVVEEEIDKLEQVDYIDDDHGTFEVDIQP